MKVTYQGEAMTALALAERIGVSESCIKKRWDRGLREADLVAPSQKGRPGVPRTFESRFAVEEAKRIRRAEEAALARRLELRRRAQERTDQARREHAAAFAKPLIDAKLVTPAESQANAAKVKGRQRWNGSWFGESHESREAR